MHIFYISEADISCPISFELTCLCGLVNPADGNLITITILMNTECTCGLEQKLRSFEFPNQEEQ